MENGDIILNSKDQQRLKVLNLVIADQLSVQQGAELLKLSERQMWRILAAYRKEGAACVPHGNKGRIPQHAFDQQLRNKVIELARTKYAGCNHQHLSELLAEHEGILISRSSVRNMLMQAGIKSPRNRRAPRHRSRRERYPQEGMLLQMDASPHEWLQGRGPRLVLVGWWGA
jgi:transposase